MPGQLNLPVLLHTFHCHVCAMQGSADLWYKKIKPQMQKIVVWALQSAKDMVRPPVPCSARR